jgi:hypothetical protein
MMIKCQDRYSINDLIAKRWNARLSPTRSVEKPKLLAILEADWWTPSSRDVIRTGFAY